MKCCKRLMICLMVMLCFAALPAYAAEKLNLWVSVDGAHGVDAIEWYQNKDAYYLFLPGNAEKDALKIGFSGTSELKIGGDTVQQGDSAAALPMGKSVIADARGKKYTLQVMQGSKGLPALYIATESGTLDKIHAKKSNKEKGTLLFINPDGAQAYSGALSQIKMRGNSSTTFKKKNYQIKLETGTNLMGMGKSRTWILTGNSRDKSHLRNQISLDIAMHAGLAYTPEHISAEVYINNQYMGLYLFSEKVMIDDDRIDITDLESLNENLNGQVENAAMVGPKKATKGQYKAYKLEKEPEDITGGYLIEFESYPSRFKEEASAYHTSRAMTLAVKSPEYASVAQMDYISGFMQGFEDAIFSKDGIDPKSGKHYSEFVDMASLVSKYMIEEIAKNYDGNNSSMFFYKPADAQSTVAFAGPVWDYDSAYGSYAQERNKHVLEGKGFWINNASGKSYWWPALYKQADFKAAVKARYQDTFKPALEILLGLREAEDSVLKSLDAYAAAIEDSAAMNLVRWPALKNPSTVAKTGHTFEMNIDYLRKFLRERYEFLNKEWAAE
nr:CotH kinase family protein [Clostridia bacterium]